MNSDYYQSCFQNEFIEECKKQIDETDLKLADIEILGSVVIIMGYLLLIIASKLDKMKIRNKNFKCNSNMGPAKVTYMAFVMAFLGIVILSYVASKRRSQMILKKNVGLTQENLKPYDEISGAYFISILAYFIRVVGANGLFKTESDEEVLV